MFSNSNLQKRALQFQSVRHFLVRKINHFKFRMHRSKLGCLTLNNFFETCFLEATMVNQLKSYFFENGISKRLMISVVLFLDSILFLFTM